MTRERIEINPDIMGGKPVIRGTRIPVETVLCKLGAGMTTDAILADHPRPSRDHILAAQVVLGPPYGTAHESSRSHHD